MDHLDFLPPALRESAAGYAALICKYDLRVPLPGRIAVIASSKGELPPIEGTEVLRHFPTRRPNDSLAGHLKFALTWEGLELGVLAALFKVISRKEITHVVAQRPTDRYLRRLWFLYEWLTGQELKINDVSGVKSIPVVDEWFQSGLSKGLVVRRQQVVNNLPGTPKFCPLVRWTSKNDQRRRAELTRQTNEIRQQRRPYSLSRASRLLNGYEVLSPGRGHRTETQIPLRWQEAVASAGELPFTRAHLEDLQRVVIGDARFVDLGLRKYDRSVSGPLEDMSGFFMTHICASPKDLPSLVEGMVAYDLRVLEGGLDAGHSAASLAFGFAYVQPFDDANGRLHRWLVQHVLMRDERDFREIVSAIGASFLRRKDKHRSVMESYSLQLLPLINFRVSTAGSFKVLDETVDFYRYFDATREAEFLFDCIEELVGELPNHIESYDRFVHDVQMLVAMPTRTLELLWQGLRQNFGKFPRATRVKEFAALTDSEVREIEAIFAHSQSISTNSRTAPEKAKAAIPSGQ